MCILMCCMPSSRASPTLPQNKHKQLQSMDIKSCLKAPLLALSLLSMVTWLPHIYSYLRTFILVSLTSLASTVVAPKCIFIFSNIIILFLVSDSNLLQSRSESLNTGDDEGDRAAAQDDTLQTQRQEEEEAVMEAIAHFVEERKREGDMVVLVEQEEDTAAVCEAVVLMDQQEKEDDMVLGEVDEMRGVVEEEEGGVELMLEEEMREGEERREVEELVERDLPPADELNRRVEDFIARFNMERQLEARMLVCCC